jgi:hypothetical protein
LKFQGVFAELDLFKANEREIALKSVFVRFRIRMRLPSGSATTLS